MKVRKPRPIAQQLELMGRYMAELGLTPVSRSRVALQEGARPGPIIDKIQFVVAYQDADGTIREEPMPGYGSAQQEAPKPDSKVTHIAHDPGL